MFMLHLLEFLFFFSVVQTHETGPYFTASKEQMNWVESFNHCKLTLKIFKEFNVTNVWLGGLYLQTPWMFHRGCFHDNGIWDAPAPYSVFEWNITSSCSYTCRKNNFFALKTKRCACLNSLFNMVATKREDCKTVCNGSKRDPCGDAKFYTVYEQKVLENLHKVEDRTVYNRRPLIKWIMNETFAEIRNATDDFHNVKCLLLNESLQYVPMSCNLNYSALCESGNERELTTNTKDTKMRTIMSTRRLKKTVLSEISSTTTPGKRQSVLGTTTNVTDQRTKTTLINHVKTSPSSNKISVISDASTTTTSSRAKSLFPVKITTISDINGMKDRSETQQNMTVIFYVSTTAPPGTNPLVLANTIKVTVITIVGSLVAAGIAIVVILFLYKRKRKRIIYYSRNSAFITLSRSVEGEQTMQMFSSNDRSRNRTNTVPCILQQKQHPSNISVSIYQDPIDMDNQYQRLDFSMRSNLKEVHDDYAMQFYKRTSTPAFYDDGSKRLKNAGLTKGTQALKEVYNNYSLPYDALSRPPAVNKDDLKIQIKVRPCVTRKDVKHNNVAYCDTAIVHEDFLYDIPKHSSKSLDNRCSIKK